MEAAVRTRLASAGPVYSRRQREKTALYQILQRHLANHVAALIEAGALRGGQRAPSVRKLSAQMKVSTATVVLGYSYLEARGLLEARPQSGLYVKTPPRTALAEPRAAPAASGAARVKLGDGVTGPYRSMRDPSIVPLGAACLSADLLLLTRLNQSAVLVARTSAGAGALYDPLPGNSASRKCDAPDAHRSPRGGPRGLRPAGRRHRDHWVPLIESDVYVDLCHDDQRPRREKAFDRDGWVMSCSSFSKMLAPGYRVGWAIPGWFSERVDELKFTYTGASPPLPQMAIADFLDSGGYDRHLRLLRRRIAAQVNVGRDAIARHFPAGTRVSRPQGGFLLWVELPRGCVIAIELQRRALACGISIAPGPIFAARDGFNSCFRLSCGYPWSEILDRAIATLGLLARGESPASRRASSRARA